MSNYYTVYSNLPNANGFHTYDRIGRKVSLLILPQFNRNIAPNVYEAISTQKKFQIHLEKGDFTVVPPVEAKGEEEGLQLTDSKEYGDERVITNQEDVLNTEVSYRPTKDLLKSFQGVGDRTADRILELMPKDGWKSKADFKAATEQFEIDWSPSGKKAKSI